MRWIVVGESGLDVMGPNPPAAVSSLGEVSGMCRRLRSMRRSAAQRGRARPAVCGGGPIPRGKHALLISREVPKSSLYIFITNR